MQQSKPISSTDEAIAGAVRAQMARRKVSQHKLWTEIHDRTGWSRSAFNRRVQGHLAMSLGEVGVIAQALGADLADLVNEALSETAEAVAA